MLVVLKQLRWSSMNHGFHRFSELFAQLGLPSADHEIRLFIQRHSPLAPGLKLDEADFWTPAQATLLKEEILHDGDWAEVVDQLNAALRQGK